MSTPEKHLAAVHPRMAELIARSIPYRVPTEKLVRPFDALAESIAYQQLSGKAAATIWRRVRQIFPRRKYLEPRLVVETPDEILRAAGLSRSKGWERHRFSRAYRRFQAPPTLRFPFFS